MLSLTRDAGGNPAGALLSLQTWITGRAAREVSDPSREAGLARVLAWLEQALHGAGARERLERWQMGDWVREPFAHGWARVAPRSGRRPRGTRGPR
jgi:hypothetical protein